MSAIVQSIKLENTAPVSASSSPPFSEVAACSHVLSRSSSASRPSVMSAAAQMKASKVRLFRNGDPFFKGIMLAITYERFRTFDSLLAELNKTTLCDPSVLHRGVRYIFTTKGEQVRSLDQLQDGYSYVCASTPAYRRMDYSKITNPMNWKMNFRNGDESKTGIAKSFGDFNDVDRNYVEPKMIYTIRAGPRPRNMARMLLNKRSARSFDQVMTDLAESVNMETGTIRQLYSVTGKQIVSLRNFFQEESIFVAFGSEKFSLTELMLNDVESKFVCGSCQRTVRSARTTARTSSQYRRTKSRSPDGRLSKANSSNVNSVIGKGTGELLPSSFPSNARAPSPFECQQTNRSVQPPLTPRLTDQSSDLPSPLPLLQEPDLSASSRGLEMLPPAKQGIPVGTKVSSERNNTQTVPLEATNGQSNDQGMPPVLLQKYRVGRVVGQCGFISLHTGVDVKNQSLVALKTYHKTKMSKKKECLVYSELALMRRMRHQNIVRLLYDLDTPETLYIVVELPKGRELLESIASFADYSEVDASLLLFELCFAINFLHSMNIVHCSIRPESLLVSLEPNGRKHLKLTDFSLATEIVAPLCTPCGAVNYMAPEMLSEKRYSTKVDVWAAGVVGYLMLCGYLPYMGSTKEEILFRIRSGPLDFPSPAWDGISDSAKDFIAFMLEEDVSIRSTATDVLDHPWLSEHEQNNFNLQPTVAKNILKLTGAMDKHKRTFAAIIGLGNLEGTYGQHSFELLDDPASDDVPPYPAAAPTSSSPHLDSAAKSPLPLPVSSS